MQGSFHTHKLLHTASSYTEKLSHRESATQGAPKWENAAKAPFATFMQPLHWDLQLSAAQEKYYAPAAAAARNLDAAIPVRSVQTELQNTKAQRQQRRDKVTWRPHYSAHLSRHRFHAKATTPATVAHAS